MVKYNYTVISNIKKLNRGEYFGECSLIFDCLTSASIKSTKYCTFALISKDVFITVCKCYFERMKEESNKYNDKLKLCKLKLLKEVEWFNDYKDFCQDD